MSVHPDPIALGTRTSEHPLSLGQEQIWLHSQLIGESSAYNESVTLTHRGALDSDVLRLALDEVIRRHEVWRTTFSEVDGQARAIVRDPQPVELSALDLRHLARDQADLEAIRLATAEARRPFDLESGPLLRFLVVNVSGDEQRLYLAIHQIIFDHVSIYNGFLPELAAIYRDLSSGNPASLAEPSIQYQDFVRWQGITYPEEVLGVQLDYWRKQLGDVQPALDLPTDRPRPSSQSYAGEQLAFELPQALTKELRALSKQEGATLFVTLVTAFAALLVRRTGDEIQTIGSVSSQRDRPELERIVGFFLNTLALRIDLAGDPSFREALRRTTNVVTDGLNHGQIPIHRVVQALTLPRDSSRSPLFQAMLTLEPPLLEAPIDWEAGPEAIDVGRALADLQLLIEERHDGLAGRIRYPRVIFDRATIESLVDQWLMLLESAVREPDKAIGDLAVLTDDERAALLSSGNRVAPSTPFERFTQDQLDQSIAARFAREVSVFPDRPAVIDSNRTWTYAELEAAADNVAGTIATAFSGAGPRVGVLGQPDSAMVATILGILKVGGAYVPLDPQFPAKRIGAIARDAELDLIVVSEPSEAHAREALGDSIRLVHMADAISRGGERGMDRALPSDPAYLLYTSGSTGEPKGTVQSNRNVLHDIRVYTNALHLGPDDRVLLVARPTFVTSVKDVFGALLNGATLCLVDLAAVGFTGLRDAIVDRRVTVYHSTPTVYRELLSTLSPDQRLTDIRAVVVGGEEVRVADFDAFRHHFAIDGVFVNAMGSTESSSRLHFLADGTSTIDRASVPVGYPVEETEVFLIDPYGRRTDFVGEIAVRSRYVALGYWNRPELTAATFKRDPVDPDLFTYRTGDLGRRLADGAFEFIGRRDRQVKVRGMRVEIAEIELAFAALPSVRQVAVEARTIDGQTNLVAYLEAAGTDRPERHDLRAALRERLPEYMVPSSIIWLDRMPLTSSNKIDRQSLPDPVPDTRSDLAVTLHDDLETQLIGIWEQVLSRNPIGVDDDFFDLGGHSLLAVRLFDRIWRETGQRIPMSALLGGATIEQLSARIREGRAARSRGVIPIRTAGTQRPLFVLPGVGSQILYLRNLARYLGSDQPIYALQEQPSGLPSQAERRIEDLASHHLAALRRVQPEGPYDLVGFSFGGPVAYEVAQQLIATGETVGLLCLIDSRHPGQLPPPGFHPGFLPRRVRNQVRILRRLGFRSGAEYLRQRARIARSDSIAGARAFLRASLPAVLVRKLRDPVLDADREWVAADIRAYARYRPKPYPGRITFLWAEHNQRPPEVFDTRRGWAQQALGGLDVRPITGSHLTVLVEPLARFTTAVLADVLGEARGTRAGRDLREERDPPPDTLPPNARR